MLVYGGSPPYRLALADGVLPPGLHLNQDSGTLSGTPTAGGEFHFALAASDAVGEQIQASFALEISGAPERRRRQRSPTNQRPLRVRPSPSLRASATVAAIAP
ncbi:MAG: Ig domain-containing protein [Candidatus Binatia bacterium]|nr:Ig domain-containing protein [Candidatus Binatia bacterium]